MNEAWIASRMRRMEASGIRKAFELAKRLTDPINFSIGLPDFDVPDTVKQAAFEAIQSGHNAYTLTMGLPELRDRLQKAVDAQYGDPDRQVIVTAGASGGLLLSLCSVVDPGDEVILFDPYFVMYNNLVALAGGVPVIVDTYPDFRVPVERVAAAITSRTKCVLFNSPNNPTGAVAEPQEVEAMARLCQERGVLLISDEVYRSFCYDSPFVSPAQWNPDAVVVDGFSKSYGMTGWRLGFAHGPSRLIQEMAKLQQFSFVCAPSPLQKAVVSALDLDLESQTDSYRAKRDRVVAALSENYELASPRGAFYAFPRMPEGWKSATEFATAAIDHNLIVIPGNVFSQRDTHFRISYAVSDDVLDRGLKVLRQMARSAPNS